MIRVHVINLERSEKRRSWMGRQLSRCPFEWSFVPAIDGSAVPMDRIRAETTTQFFSQMMTVGGEPTLRGTYGCAQSHARIQTRVAEEFHPNSWHLILEDDVSITPQLWKTLPTIAKVAAQHGKWQVLLGMHWFWGHGVEKPVLHVTNTGHELRNMPSQGVNGAFGYLLTPQAAKHLLDAQSPKITNPADHWPALFKSYVNRLGIVTPHLVTTGGFSSDISYGENKLKVATRTIAHRFPVVNRLLQYRLRHIAKRSD